MSKQLNAISMGLSKQKSSPIHSYKIRTHTRKQVILLKTLSKQLNAISMGLSKQKSSPIDSYKKFIPGSKYYCLKHCRNSTMLFQWVCRNRNSVLLIQCLRKDYLNTVSKRCNVISMGMSK